LRQLCPSTEMFSL